MAQPADLPILPPIILDPNLAQDFNSRHKASPKWGCRIKESFKQACSISANPFCQFLSLCSTAWETA